MDLMERPERTDARTSRGRRQAPRGPGQGSGFHLVELDLEHERGVRRDDAARPGCAVTHLGRDRELALAADSHALHPLVPAGDDLAGAETELERLAANRAVELGPVAEPTGVVDRDARAGRGDGAGADGEVFDLESCGMRLRLAEAERSVVVRAAGRGDECQDDDERGQGFPRLLRRECGRTGSASMARNARTPAREPARTERLSGSSRPRPTSPAERARPSPRRASCGTWSRARWAWPARESPRPPPRPASCSAGAARRR